MTVAQSSPTDVHLTFSGGLGTSGYRCVGGRGRGDGEKDRVRERKCFFLPRDQYSTTPVLFNEQKFSNILRVFIRISIKCRRLYTLNFSDRFLSRTSPERKLHPPTIFTKSSALSSPAGLVTVME